MCAKEQAPKGVITQRDGRSGGKHSCQLAFDTRQLGHLSVVALGIIARGDALLNC